MTQHILTSKDPSIAHAVMVGYDRPLATFYAQVWTETPDGGPDFLVFLGYQEAELPDAQLAINAVHEYAIIPDGLLQALANDRAHAPFRTMAESNAVTEW